MVRKAYLAKDFGKELVQRLFDQDYSLSILIEVISKVNPQLNDKAQLKNITIDLEDLRDFAEMKNNNAILILKAAIKKIKETIIEFDDGRIWEPVSFFDKAYINNDDNTVNIDINDRFLPSLTNLKEFLVLSRNAIKANLRSLRFYTYLRSIHRDTPKNIRPEDIQAQMGVSYKKYSEFKRNLLIPIQKDLKQAGINLAFQENKGIRNKIKSLDFFLDEPQEKIDKIIAETKAKNKDRDKPKPSDKVYAGSYWKVNEEHNRKQYADINKTKKLIEETHREMTPEEIEVAKLEKEKVKAQLFKQKGDKQ